MPGTPHITQTQALAGRPRPVAASEALRAPAEPLNLDGGCPVTALVIQDWLGRFGPVTACGYASCLRDATRFADDAGAPLLGLTRPLLQAYVRHLQQTRGLASATVARRLVAVCGLLRHAHDHGWLAEDPTLGLRRPRVARQSQNLGLSISELGTVLAASERHSPRAFALVSMLILNGLRLSECLSPDAGDLQLREAVALLTVVRKGGDRTTVPVSGTTHRALRGYLQGRQTGALLLSRTGRRLDRSNAARLFGVVVQGCLPPERAAQTTCHSARHGAASALALLGVPLMELTAYLHHTDPLNSLRYIHGVAELTSHPTYLLEEALVGAPAALSRRPGTGVSLR